MLHDRGLVSVSSKIEALQFLIPCTSCDELVVNGGDRPSWRGSFVVRFNIWLNKTRVPSLKWLIPTRNKETKHQKHDRKTAHGTNAIFFLPVENPYFVHLFFTTQILQHNSRPHKNSSSCECSCWTRTDGVATSLRFSAATGRERTVPGRAPPHTPLLELRTRAQFSRPPGTSFLPTGSQMLDD